MQIVPDDARLEVEALVPNRDAGFMAPGQSAQIKLEAFPFAVYGTLDSLLQKVIHAIAGQLFSTRADAMISDARAPLL